MTPTESILSRLPDAKPTKDGWSARCPGHEDKRASLSINEGDDGRALIYCHTGCAPEAIVDAMGLKMSDLMPVNGKQPSLVSPQRPGSTGRNDKREPELYATARDAVTELQRRHGSHSKTWTYRDAAGEPVGMIVRWDTPTGKDYRPVSKISEGWIIGGMPDPRPPYNLPDLLARRNEPVYFCEGEKACDAATAIGLLSTTTAHGSQSPGKTDLQPLAGREVNILPDNDDPGRKYAEKVASMLSKLQPPAVVRIVKLHDLPSKGDLFDWVEAHGDVEPDTLRTMIDDIVKSAPPCSVVTGDAETTWPDVIPLDEAEVSSFHPDWLPPALRDYAQAIADTVQVPLDLPAMMTLVAVAACVAKKYTIHICGDWREPLNLFVLAIIDSGNRKSQVLKDIAFPIRDYEKQLVENKRAEVIANQSEQRGLVVKQKNLEKQLANGENYSRDLEKVNLEIAEFVELHEPVLLVDNCTPESMGLLMSQNDGRLALLSAEGGLFGRITGHYSNGQPDLDIVLKAHSAEDALVNRIGRARNVIPEASLTLGLMVQPTVLANLRHKSYLQDVGLLPRFLFTCPPSSMGKRGLNRDHIPEHAKYEYRVLLERFLSEELPETPRTVELSEGAMAVFEEFYVRIEEDLLTDLTGSKAWLGKLCGAVGRIAGLMHLVKGDGDAVTVETMLSAMNIGQYLIAHAEKALGMMNVDPDFAVALRIVRWITRNNIHEFGRGEIFSALKTSQLQKATQLDGPLRVLATHCYIRPVNCERLGSGRPAERYEVNPGVFEMRNSGKKPL
ncbi:MAG: DUF3987 domain-containing protein [Planctomycetes bacterium]|nr:DUF3987 domain-containing protein [Planctomycetota bacterium]